MSSRKRRQPDPPASPATPLKRTRFQESLPQSPSKTISGEPTCKSGASVYAIQGIVDERDDKYLIEWENSSKTTWQPKKNANAAAVSRWEAQKAAEEAKSIRRGSSISVSGALGNRAAPRTPSVSQDTTPPVDSHLAENKVSAEATSPHHHPDSPASSQQSVHLITSSLDTSNFKEVVVEVPSPRSFDKEGYRYFNSSTSTQDTQRTSKLASDSQRESSSHVDSSVARRRSEIETVVPDSQSLPQDSSYIPTQTTSDEPGEVAQTRHSTDIQEPSTDIVIPASQGSTIWSQRKKSEPSLNLQASIHRSATEKRRLSLPPTLPNPALSVGSSEETRPFVPRRRSNHRVIIDSPSPQASAPEHQPELPLESIELPEDITQYQPLAPSSQIASGEHEDIVESSEESPGFVTQVPLQLGDGTSRPTSESFVPLTRTPGDTSSGTSEAGEAGQAYPRISHPASLLSSGTRTPAQVQSVIFKETLDSDQSTSIDRPSNLVRTLQDHDTSEPTSTAGDLGLQLQTYTNIDIPPTTQATGGQPAPAKAAYTSSETWTSTESRVDPLPEDADSHIAPESPRNSNFEGRFTTRESVHNPAEDLWSSGIQINRLPSSINSSVPPRPPIHSDIEMSEAQMISEDSLANGRSDPTNQEWANSHTMVEADVEANIAAFKANQAQAEQQIQTTVNDAPPEPSIRRTEIEVKPKPEFVFQSPKGPKSPSIARIIVTPRGPLSPNAIASPLSAQMASARSTRSPSKIPEREPYKSQEEPSFIGVDPTQIAEALPLIAADTEDFDGALTPRGQHQNDEFGSAQQNSTPRTSLAIQNLGPREFVMPLSMPPRAQKEYLNTYRNYVDKIYSFNEGQDVSRELVEELNSLLDRIAKVTSHAELEGGGPDSQDEVDVVKEADFSASISAKFKFLDHVLAKAKNRYMHIVIVARPGQLCDFIETTLKARTVNYTRLVQQTGQEEVLRSRFEFDSDLRVTLLASDTQDSACLHWIKKADLVVAFDETFNADRQWMRSLRNVGPSELSPGSPVIRLVVNSSLEHINLCLPLSLEPNERLKRLLIHLSQAERTLGQLASGNVRGSPFDPENCAEELVDWVDFKYHQQQLILPEIPPIESIALRENDTSLSDARSEASELRTDDTIHYWPYLVARKTRESRRKPGEKRPLDLQYGESLEVQSKKMKLGPSPKSAKSGDPLDIVQSIKDKERIQELERQLRFAKSHNYPLENPLAWPNRVKVYEKERSQRGDLQTALGATTYKFDKAERRLEITQSENATLKSTLKSLQTQLSAHQTTLLTHPDPSIRDAEHTRRRLTTLESTATTQAKKLHSTESDLAYTRDMYQKASTAATSSSSELADVQLQLDDAETRLRAAQRQRSLTRAAERRAMEPLVKENVALKATLRQRQKEVDTARAELELVKRGRPGVSTRQSSIQPSVVGGGRSPRGSRGGSPAVVGVGGVGGVGGVPMGRGPSGLGSGGGRLGLKGL